MGLQINLGFQQQLIVLIVSLSLGLHTSPLGGFVLFHLGLRPFPLGPLACIWPISGYVKLVFVFNKRTFGHSFQIREKASLRVPVEPNSDLSRLIPCGITVTYLPSLEVASLSVNNPVSNILPRKIHVTPILLQGFSFTIDLHILPISGTNIVLGI